jgi:septal ring-binding cell division protein DamX
MGIMGRKGGSDVVLESRHVIGVFLLMVVISGIVFTLGYVMGRSQYDAKLGTSHASNKDSPAPVVPAAAPTKPGALIAKTQPAAPDAPPPSDWDFSRPAETKKSAEGQRAGKSTSGSAKSTAAAPPATKPAAARGGALFNAPLIPRGAILLQVAALTKEGDALALAEALQQKKFPAFVLTPSADHYYRVQVGPYADVQSANMVKRGLENEGFKAIVKR